MSLLNLFNKLVAVLKHFENLNFIKDNQIKILISFLSFMKRQFSTKMNDRYSAETNYRIQCGSLHLLPEGEIDLSVATADEDKGNSSEREEVEYVGDGHTVVSVHRQTDAVTVKTSLIYTSERKPQAHKMQRSTVIFIPGLPIMLHCCSYKFINTFLSP